MKKIFFALAALVLAFTGCSQEEDAIQVSEKKAVKVVVNMDKPGFGEDTRAARTGWETGDEVVAVLANQFGVYVKLTYQEDKTWETAFCRYDEDEEAYIELSEGASVSLVAEIEAALPSGSIKAAYFSSGVLGVNYNETYVHIITKALTQNMGECIMTCKDGEYSVSGGVLTLNITMKPQVAQFTIRDLNVADDWNVYANGPFNFYAGGTITSADVELTPISLSEAGSVYCHDNKDGISFYVAPWQSEADMPEGFDDEYYVNYYFNVYNDDLDKYREFLFTQVEIGDAVIFDGPYTEDEDGEPTAGAQEWEFYE